MNYSAFFLFKTWKKLSNNTMSDVRAFLQNGRQNDPVDQGKIVRTFALDQDSIIEAKQRLENGKTPYKGVGEDKDFGIYKGELMFERVKKHHFVTQSMNPKVFSNFLGQPEEENSLEDGFLSEDLTFVGIAVGSGVKYDSTERGASYALAGVSGGVIGITNNSTTEIKNHDELMWLEPAKGQTENNKSYKGSKRYLARIVVFDQNKHELTVRSFVEYLKKSDGTSPVLSGFEKEFLKAAALFKEVLETISNNPDFVDQLTNGNKDVMETTTKLFKIVDQFNQKIRARIFATALNYCEPGNLVDIKLKHSYEY